MTDLLARPSRFPKFFPPSASGGPRRPPSAGEEMAPNPQITGGGGAQGGGGAAAGNGSRGDTSAAASQASPEQLGAVTPTSIFTLAQLWTRTVNSVTTLATVDIATVTFNADERSTAVTLNSQGTTDGGIWVTLPTTVTWDRAQVVAHQTSFTAALAAAQNSQNPPLVSSSTSASRSRTTATPEPANTQATSSNSGAKSSHIAGAAVGSFFAGAIACALLFAGFLMWRKRKQRQHQRDMQIKRSFETSPSTPANKQFQDIALSSMSDTKPLPTPARGQGLKPAELEAAPSKDDNGQTHRDSDTSFYTVGDAAAKRGSVAGKRLSFPRALSSERLRRTISISANGLISPVAANFAGSRDEDTTERIIKQLRMQVSMLFEQIEMHVDNFYNVELGRPGRPGPHQLTVDEQSRLHQFDSPYLHDSIAGLLPMCRNARWLIKHSLAEVMTSRIDYTSRVEPGVALMPRSLLEMYRLMAASSNPQSALALKRWRTQSLSLLGIDNVEKSMTVQIRNLAINLTEAFKPWAVERYGAEARSSHLSNILKEAVELGLEIFGMQDRARWDWGGQRSKYDPDVYIFPGFVVEEDLNSSNATDEPKKASIEVVKAVVVDETGQQRKLADER